MSIKRGYQSLSISDIEEQLSSTPIYAINSSAESGVGQAGDILLGIPKINGSKIDGLRIPQTWLPVELTLQIARNQLLAASEFRQAIQSNLLILIGKDDAQRMNTQAGAKQERERIAAQQNHVRTAGGARTISDSATSITRANANDNDDDDESSSKDYDSMSVAQKAQAGVENVEAGITPSFQMWADRLATDTDMGAVNTMRSKGRFSRLELKYLQKNLTNHPKALLKIKKVLASKNA